MAKGKKSNEIAVIQEINTQTVDICIIGKTPLICNRMSVKASQQLLLPKKKTNAEKSITLKHNPLEEYRESPYKSLDNDNPTRIQLTGVMFKKCLMNAALDIPGATKSQIGRLTWVENDRVDVYGIPQLSMMITRSADINRTPDVRTRAIIPHWACKVSVTFVVPMLNSHTIVNLLSASGLISGVGDFRPQKGSGNYGQFAITTEDNPAFQKILKEGGLAAQDAALASPECYDDETMSLLQWWKDEVGRRGIEVAV